MRHNRNRPHPAQEPVSSYTVAPHRYLWDSLHDLDPSPAAMPFRDFKAGAQYQSGEVVWIAYGDEARLAFIADVFVDYDTYGDRRHKFKVYLANKKGDRFAKTWFYTWPGMIQRGYARAGLAPDVKV